MRILIGGPARQNVPTFVEHLKCIKDLELPEGVKVDLFYILNDCPELKKFLQPDEYIEINTGDDYSRTEEHHEWKDDNLSKMSLLRNRFLTEILKGGYDYGMFIDTDVCVQPDTLKWLLASGKDIIAEIFWTKWRPGSEAVWANCWEYDQSVTDTETYKKWTVPGVYRVGGTGACMLVSAAVPRAHVSYSPFYNIRQALRGEDRWFMLRAVSAGFELFIDTHAPAWHLYRQGEYEEYMRYVYGTDQ